MRSHAGALERWSTDAYRKIQRIFAIWLSRLLKTRFKKDAVPEYHALTEVEAMLAEKMTEWTEEWKSLGKVEGKMEGRLEGKMEGRLEGKMEERMQTIKILRTEKFQTLTSLHNLNISPDKIAKIVNLPVEKIHQIIASGDRGMDLIQAEDMGLTGTLEDKTNTETP